MSAPRKTIDVQTLVNIANISLGFDDTDQAWRRGVIVTLESALFATNNYRGYSYLPTELDEQGQLRQGYDDTRRKYAA